MGCENVNCKETLAFVGTQLKFALTVTADGFSMDDDDFEVTLKSQSKSLTIKKEDMVHDDTEGQWYFTFDSAAFGPGLVSVIVTASVPDDDFDGGVRREVVKRSLIRIMSV